MKKEKGLYVALASVHGLLRGRDMELGRDPDTGGQIKYVVELARALARDPRVARVDLLTRRIEDPKVDKDYAAPIEDLGDGASIVRLPFGTKRYLRKEVLWPHLETFVDQVLKHVRRVRRIPDIVHSHYADAGYIGAKLAGSLGIPLIHTGHSLGQAKRERLCSGGMSADRAEKQFHLRQRIEAEEIALDNASFVVASTQQEVDEQYASYDNYKPQRMVVIPPGVDLTRFRAPKRGDQKPNVQLELERFLNHPTKPMILALSRADTRKNLANLVKAYGENPDLQEAANFVIVAGNRNDIRELAREPREIWTELLALIDRYDLYGKVAYPKRHEPDDVPELYRLAARRRGVFVNPALTEPFGLTLIESAASGLPIVATNDGGPQDIIARCQNGYLIDPLNPEDISRTLLKVLTDRATWKRLSTSGLRGVRKHYSWKAHVNTYLRMVRQVAVKSRSGRLVKNVRNRLAVADRILICDIDNTLVGDRAATRAFVERLKHADKSIGFGVATGRNLSSTLSILKKWRIPQPDVLITSVGAEIRYGSRLHLDESWERHVAYRWEPPEIRKVMKGLPGVRLQLEKDQMRFKVSYFVDPEKAPPLRELSARLRQNGAHVNLVFSGGMFLDVLPVHASKGRAVRYLSIKWGLPADRFLTAGDSGNDAELLSGDTLAVVVANYSEEIEKLRGRARVYFSDKPHAWGILDGIDHYGFFSDLKETGGGKAGEPAEEPAIVI